MIYDVVVIGAGSNGATAAYFLAKKGFNTILLEMSREPGEKCHGATEYAPVPLHGESRPELAALMKKVIKKIPTSIRGIWEREGSITMPIVKIAWCTSFIPRHPVMVGKKPTG